MLFVRVYQKAYVECFVSPDNANRLTRMVTDHPNMNLYAVNYTGQELRVGAEEGGVTALTWVSHFNTLVFHWMPHDLTIIPFHSLT